MQWLSRYVFEFGHKFDLDNFMILDFERNTLCIEFLEIFYVQSLIFLGKK